ncbi:short-chain dehydrogenase [Seiridium cupressi]
MDSSSLFRVDEMVAVVTGGGSGIGLMMARALAGAGAKKVYILGRRQNVLEQAAKDHSSLSPLECDVTSKESLQSAVDTITKETGYVNLLIANSELRKSLFDDMDMGKFTQAFHVNVSGAFFTITAFLELLDAGNKNALKGGFGAPLEQGSDVQSIQSQVIITSSISAYSRIAPSAPAYSGSKSAIAHLSKLASTNLAKYGIRVNALAPGLFPSELAAGLIGSRDPGTEGSDHPGFIPSRRLGGEEDMGGTVLYLASRAGAFCNGLILVTDGGRLSVMLSEY